MGGLFSEQEQPCAFLAVYDGHRGPLCAEFVAKSLHLRLLKHLSQPTTKGSEEIGLALKAVCQELDEEFLAKHRTLATDWSRRLANSLRP